ncbi:ferredoxin--NADP reductase [Paraferrimonas haliotis]|uniref:ferredoxin--NADP(+) reductase n=1 Tax=Paraferrimonas haliotis TaxID=2013866 RepID=A0AA37WW15_9GAMM|nr:ferredoxin--NADP reductase [Paraferrimonas haliotis]GLS83058.1 ferredoxin--NADP(+) reductase [Paraferrimonas haliotis]
MWVTGKIIKRIDWNEKLFTLVIDADIGDFKAGQFIKLSQYANDKRVARAYSLVNAENARHLEVLAVTVEDGQLSPQLHRLESGDEIEVSSKAAGFLVLDEVPAADNLWMLATGTAVGPFISMLLGQEVWRKYKNIRLAYGARFQEDLAYKAHLDEIAAHHSEQFAWQPLITRENFNGNIQQRIPQALASETLQQQLNCSISPLNSQVMLCGNPDMISETVELLKSMGLEKNLRRKPGQITVEKYW